MKTPSQMSEESMQRGLDCLKRFAQLINGMPAGSVRIVGTNALREARNRDDFLTRGSEVLGYPIDVVSGPEEARLIYQGVARLLPQSDERRLVVDIGGRSTELILGEQFTPHAVASFRVGSVAWSMKYFPQGQFTTQAFQIAEIAAKAVQIHGGYGYIKEYPVERKYRDCRVFTIYEGTSQVQHMVISGNLLK